jgi:hypothetical protein
VVKNISSPQILGYSMVLALAVVSLLVGYTVATQYDEPQALLYDASLYWQMAQEFLVSGPPALLSGRVWFADLGYPLFLSSALAIFGNSFRVGQVANVLMFTLCGLLSFLAVRKLMSLLGRPLQRWWQFPTAGLFLLSPCFLTFSGKLYSEILAALGLSLVISSVLYLWDINSRSRQLSYKEVLWIATYLVGSFIFYVTKSAFFPLVIAYAALFLLFRKRLLLVATIIIFILILPFQISAQQGGRGQYNFFIQVAKVELGWTYPEIAIGGVYSFSSTLGILLFPLYEYQFAQNLYTDPGKDQTPPVTYSLQEKYQKFPKNPYPKASSFRTQGLSYIDGFRVIAKDPVRYAAVVLFTLPGAVAVEGIYPTVTDRLPSAVRMAVWLVLKMGLSVLLWFGVAILLFRRKQNRLIIVLGAPFVIFLLVQGNTYIEQRYLFPLLPLIWTLAICQLLLAFSKPSQENRRVTEPVIP